MAPAPSRSQYEQIGDGDGEGHVAASVVFASDKAKLTRNVLVFGGVLVLALVSGMALVSSSDGTSNGLDFWGVPLLPVLARGSHHDHDGNHKHHHDSDQHGPHNHVHDALHKLSKKLKGKIIYQTQKHTFAEASEVWNECSAEQPPLAVVEVANEHDVTLSTPVLAHLQSHPDVPVPFRVKSGGHSYTGWSSVGGGIVLSLRHLDRVHVNTDTGIAKLGPAATVQDVLGRALPLGYGAVEGFCPGVAAGGYLLGGGIGVQTRQYGLGLDNVLSARMVTAKGEVVVANASSGEYDAASSSDLFWALRGAGNGNFGVVTEITYQLHPLPGTVETGNELLSVEGMVPLDMIPQLNSHLGTIEETIPGNWFALYEGGLEPDGPRALPMAFYYTGDIDEGKQYAKDNILPLFPQDVASEFEINSQSWYDWTVANGNLEGNYVRAWTGFLNADNNTEEAWSVIMDALTKACDISEYLIVDVELLGGAVSEPASDSTAFPYRDALWNAGLLLLVPTEEGRDVFDDIVLQVDEIWNSVEGHQYFDGVYVNYQVESLSQDEYPKAYWGSNLERLMEVKAKYDPENVFNHPQSVPLPK